MTSFSAATMGAMLGAQGNGAITSGYGSTDPMQNPNWQITNDRQYDIQNTENLALNELFNVRHGQGMDTFRSLQRPIDVNKRVADARNEAGASADVAEGIFSRRTEGMGLTDRQKQGAKQRLSLNREVTLAAAGTGARRTANDERRQADRAITGFEDIAFGQQIGGLTGLANAEGQRRVRVAQEKAAKKSSKYGMLGTLGGLAIGALAVFSAEEYKDRVEEKPKLLDKLKGVRIDKWKYKGSKPEHIGPYAEEFNEAFGVGSHKDAIDVVSMLGITLGSIKELNEKVEASLG